MFAIRLLLCLFVGLLPALSVQAAPVTVTDVLGRTVTLPDVAKRVVLVPGRYLPVLSLLHPDPVSILAGWTADFKNSVPQEYEAYQKAFPAIDKVPMVGGKTPDSISAEQVLSVRPDLVIMSAFIAEGRGKGDGAQALKMMEAAGIPVVVVDFFLDPMKNTEPSVALLGKVLGRETQASEFLSFYRERMQAVAQGAPAPGEPRRNVFIHVFAGSTTCCHSPGTGTFHGFIELAGGRNIAAGILNSPTGLLSQEFVLSQQPDVYIVTGIPGAERAGGVPIGTGITAERASTALRDVVARSGLQSLNAVSAGNVHGIWHTFNDTPLHVVMVEALARWTNPERFGSLDPQATINEINKRFLAVPMVGTYAIEAPAAP